MSERNIESGLKYKRASTRQTVVRFVYIKYLIFSRWKKYRESTKIQSYVNRHIYLETLVIIVSDSFISITLIVIQ